MKRIIVLILIITALQEIEITLADDYEYQLVNDLLQNYSKIPRPTDDHNKPTTVFINLSLRQIMDVDERNQVISVYSWLVIKWKDSKLSWDPNKYNNLTEIKLSTLTVWLPDLTIGNAAEKIQLVDDYEVVIVEYDGTLIWLPNSPMRAYCQINVEYFPFDIQNCSLIFLSITSSPDQIAFETATKPNLGFYQNSSEWDLLNFTVAKHLTDVPVQSTDVTFYMTIKRKPLFYVFNMILPCVTTVVVAFLAFLVPIESGEKMSISITALLSIIVLLLVIANELPACSDYIPLIGYFYVASTGCIALISLVSVLTLNIYHNGEKGVRVPKIIQKIFFSILGRIIMFPKTCDFCALKMMEHNNKTIKSSLSIKSEIKETKFGCIKQLMKYGYCKSSKVGCEESEESEEEIFIDKDLAKLQWTLLADIIDRLFFYIFSVTTFFILIGIINGAPSSPIY